MNVKVIEIRDSFLVFIVDVCKSDVCVDMLENVFVFFGEDLFFFFVLKV